MKVKEFIVKLDGSDQELLNKLGACKNPDEAYDVAKSYGVDEPQEIFVAEMTKFYDAVRELDESELEDVAGGMTKEEVVVTAVSAAVVSCGVSLMVPIGVTATALGAGLGLLTASVVTSAASAA